MKRFFVALMLVALLAGMSLPALAAQGICPGPAEENVEVKMEIGKWTKVEWEETEFNFDLVNFCKWSSDEEFEFPENYVDGYRLYFINGTAFRQRQPGATALPKGQGAWKDVPYNHVNKNVQEVNPRFTITTNTTVDIDFEFQRQNWPVGLPTIIAVWKVHENFVSLFGQNVDGLDTMGETVKIVGPAQQAYHFDAGILFDEDFWKIPAGEYAANILVTVSYPSTL